MRELIGRTVVIAVCVAAPTIAAAQAISTTISVRPNPATLSFAGFTVCAGTAANRALYGSRVTGTTGIVSFRGAFTSGTQVLTTVWKTGFIGREQIWTVGAVGSAQDVPIAMVTGSGGPTCQPPPPPPPPLPPPATSSARVYVQPTSKTSGSGFYVCLGTEYNRAQYGSGVTTATGVNFSGLPASGSIKATVVRAGFTGSDRDWTPTPDVQVSLGLSISPGSGGVTCPGYVSPVVKEIRPAITLDPQQGEVGMPVAVLPAARVLDQYGNGLAGVSVSFSVAQGGGMVTPGSVVTGSDGIARVTSWSLGPNVGTNVLRAATEGATSNFVFSANGIRVPQTLVAITAISQKGAIGTPVADPPGVAVRDRNGNPVQAARVSFTASTGSGLVSPGVVVTGSDGIARLTSWTIGSLGGDLTVRAGMPSLTGVTFTTTVPYILREGTGTISLTPSPPARLMEKPLACHGQMCDGGGGVTYSCRTFGSNYVLVGLRVTHRVTELYGLDLFCAGLAANGTLGNSIFLPGMTKVGTQAQAVCPSGQVVVGVQGTTSYYIRSLRLHCSKLLPTGLADASVPTKHGKALGIESGSFWGADICPDKRPASAVKVNWSGAPSVNDGMFSFQMFCEQPTRGN